MKKVGILTFHYSNHNFGALLQTYSVYKIIENLGYEPIIIDYKPEVKGFKKKLIHTIQKVSGHHFSTFRKEYLSNIAQANTDEDLRKLNDVIDIFSVGSDQVWRYRSEHKVLKRYYLDFVRDDKKKVAIAASFGVAEWSGTKKITKEIKYLAKKFDAVSVREEDGVKICSDVFNIECKKILDPTILIDQNEIYGIAERSKRKIKEKYLAYMLLDDSSDREIFFKKVADTNNLNFKKIKGNKLTNVGNIWWFNSVSKWLSYLMNSDLIITDSFHTVVFSMIFRKNFICLSNSNRGISRLKNILELVGLDERLVTSLDEDNIADICKKNINYDNVWNVLNREKNKSLEFIKDSLR